MRIGFVGVGNMGGAILDGLMSSGAYQPKEVSISGSNPNRLKELKLKYDVVVSTSNLECVTSSDIVFLGVKPDIHAVIAHEFKDEVKSSVLVSMAAKVSLQELERIYGRVAIVRIMPNLNVTIQEGITAICRNQYVSDEHYEAIQTILQTLGEVVEIEESLMSAFIGIAGSSPAFVFRFIDELIKPAIADGMDPKHALHIASVAVSGSAHYLDVSEESATQLIKNVSSPNGTTVEGLKMLDKYGFDETIEKAVVAVMKKDKGEL
ncbi:hypothetical protein AOC36_03270 [Erysipelothrix larvae]|uniref:Pyrroline-5-carboxylate reductase n=1 Tax=Erysipelothrix larvae TaxID=1514105 RepID=A0A0X8GZ14_9FIRM|nr:pyrroline-5-carboxylate reductase [Erysipelothrix larvae]AMC93036.1 hypothetical protein AOC36_03270 [Erysipelothrix larvae]